MITSAQGANAPKQMPEQPKAPAVVERNISDNVLARINQFQQAGALKLPKDYSPENALKVAFLQLTDQTVKTGNGEVSVLAHCTQSSIANSLLKMVTQGMNPMKRQCSFIAYGTSLTMQREFQGSVALAKRYKMKDINANVIYEGDVFEYEIDTTTGRKKLLKHEQNFENIDLAKIKGAYAITIMEDGTTALEVMNIGQIKKAWAMGYGGGNTKAHTNFTDEMCKKTVINRACKPIINSSDDSNLYDDDDNQNDKSVTDEIQKNANVENLDFADAVILDDKKVAKPEPTEQAPVNNPTQQVTQTSDGQQTLTPGF
jgi:recombination protein RecT